MALQYKITVINKLQEKGVAGELYKLGMLNTKLLFYANAYNYYDALIKTSDEETEEHKRQEAIKKTAKRFGVERRTIYNVIHEMETKVDIEMEKVISITGR